MNSNDNINDFFVNLEWNDPVEKLLVSWADIAMCYTWIYEKSYRHLNKLHFKFSLPIIILSTVTGTLSMSLRSIIPDGYQDIVQIGLGGINIFTGIITTLQNFFRYAQQSELSLTATTDWSKLHRNIKIELSIERHNRRPATEFVRATRQEYERLLNSRPVIDQVIIYKFNKEFENSDIIKPEILDKVEHTIIYQDAKTIDLYRSNVDRSRDKKGKMGFLERIVSIVTPSNSQSQKNSLKPSHYKRNRSVFLDNDYPKTLSLKTIKRNLAKNESSTEGTPSSDSYVYENKSSNSPSYENMKSQEQKNISGSVLLNQIKKNNLDIQKILINTETEDEELDLKVHIDN
jgi:hypothetical protein